MVTDISGVGFSYMVASQTGTSMARQVAAPLPSETLARQSDESGSREAQVRVGRSSQVAGVYSQLRVKQEEANQAAGALRETAHTLDESGQLLDDMEEQLAAIVKMYPPYPVDNPERVSLLNNVSGLRRQIDELTFPPPERIEAAKRLISADASRQEEEVKPLSLLDDSMWDIPVLNPETADDDAVAQTLQQVRTAKSVLEAVRGGMWEDIVRQAREEEAPLALDQASQTRDLLAVLPETAGIGQDKRALSLTDVVG